MQQHQQFVMSRPYYHDALTWCVQKAQLIPRWKNLFRLGLDPIFWTVYTIMAISVISTFHFLQQFEDVQPKWDWLRLTFTAMCCNLSFVCNYKPKIISNRILFIFCLFGSMIYVITVMSFMLNVINRPIFENQVKTIEETIDNSYDFAGDGYAFQHLMKQNEVIYTNK